MKKLLLILLCLPFLSLQAQNKTVDKKYSKQKKKKSWLQQWGYKGKIKSSSYTTYNVNLINGNIKKGSIIDSAFYSIDEWIFPYGKTEFNLFGNPVNGIWYRNQSKKSKTTRKYVYKGNELDYIIEEPFRIINAKNNKFGYLDKLSLNKNEVANFERDYNGYIIKAKYDAFIQKNKYDSNGNWIESKTYTDNKLIQKASLSYFNNKRKRALVYDASGDLINTYQFGKYDEENNFTEIIIYDSNQVPIYLIDFKRTYFN